MIDVIYVGSLREELALPEEKEQIGWRDEITDVATLIEVLCEERGERWSRALRRENLLISVNQSMVKPAHPLADGDEVMIFPPIAGG